VDQISIRQLSQIAGESAISAIIDTQVQSCTTKTTRNGKPYLELSLADSTGSFTLKIWSDRPQFNTCQELPKSSFLRLTGEWTQNQYGIDSTHWDFRLLNEAETQNFLAGDPETAKRQHSDWKAITDFLAELKDPRLKALCNTFVEEYEERFRRTAAARKNHHARRGGLVEHVAQMMRLANSVCQVYPDLNQDLLISSVLFHDSGKLWENTYPENGFAQIHNLHGEMMGHISLGIELVNKLWRPLQEKHSNEWLELEPTSEDVRIHLLHLIASHHGQLEFGSPVLPKTPEAMVLHHIDNIDAKFEMMRDSYATSELIIPGVYERRFPLPTSLVEPLPAFEDEQISLETLQTNTHDETIGLIQESEIENDLFS